MHEVSRISPQERMIQRQIIDRGIRDERIIEAFRRVPRERFFPADLREEAFADNAAPIGHGQTISQPFMVALMTRHLEIQPEHRVLEIGTGSGYHTALLAYLAAEVYTVERVKPLLDEAWERLMELGLRNVHFRFADGTIGWPEAAPFDRIIIGAGAPRLPRDLLMANLANTGIAVLPVGPEHGQVLVAAHRIGDELEVTELCACRFVKLVGEGGWPVEQ